jgi:hypothetical protein
MLGNKTIVGTCSCCGGCVSCPLVYWSVVPPVPSCERCGARVADDFGPVVKTVPVVPATIGQNTYLQGAFTPEEYERLLRGEWKTTSTS